MKLVINPSNISIVKRCINDRISYYENIIIQYNNDPSILTEAQRKKKVDEISDDYESKYKKTIHKLKTLSSDLIDGIVLDQEDLTFINFKASSII